MTKALAFASSADHGNGITGQIVDMFVPSLELPAVTLEIGYTSELETT
jgi:hypothetical protein